jgi:hypothetical protein
MGWSTKEEREERALQFERDLKNPPRTMYYVVLKDYKTGEKTMIKSYDSESNIERNTGLKVISRSETSREAMLWF